MKHDGSPLCVANYGLGTNEGKVGNGGGGLARFETSHNELLFNKNINEEDNEILQVESKAQQGSCNWNSINNYGLNGTKLQIQIFYKFNDDLTFVDIFLCQQMKCIGHLNVWQNMEHNTT